MSSIPEIKTILYATDMGRHMRPVFRQAISMAQSYNAEIIMLHVLEPLGSTGEAVLSTYLPGKKLEKLEHEGMKKVLKKMKERLESFCHEEMELCEKKNSMVKEILVTTGHPADRIPQEAEKHNADIIVIGSCSKGFIRSGLFGSTVRHVTQVSHLPVLVVPNCNR
ncbi:MAG: universal stress protein [Candidatus Thiodiazotropha sp. 6PDIVS]